MNSILKEIGGKFKYDKKGIEGIFNILISDIQINTDDVYLKQVNEMKEVFIEKI